VIAKPRVPSRTLFQPGLELEYFPAIDVLRFANLGAVGQCDPASGTLRIVVSPGDARAAFVGSHLFFTLALLEQLKRRDRFAVHAGGVVAEGRAILIAGASGSGKTTLAVAGVLAGLELLGDDLVLLHHREGEDSLILKAFPDELDLADDALAFFDSLKALFDQVKPRVSGKRSLHPLDVPGMRLAWEARPAAIVFPSRTRRTPSRMRPISDDDALGRLVANVVRTERVATQRHLDALAVLARTAKAFEIDVGDPGEAPSIFRDILEGG
jgi:hypothetical protein